MNSNFTSPLLRPVRHVPKGHMCAHCVHMFDDCSGKNFSDMPHLEGSYMRGSNERFIIVRCTDYVKKVD
jgi:hypothetical protein